MPNMKILRQNAENHLDGYNVIETHVFKLKIPLVGFLDNTKSQYFLQRVDAVTPMHPCADVHNWRSMTLMGSPSHAPIASSLLSSSSI